MVKMMLVYCCEVDGETKESGRLKRTYPENPNLWIHKVPTWRDHTQIRTTSPLESRCPYTLCSLETTKQRKESFSWGMRSDFGWCQRSWGSFSLFVCPFLLKLDFCGVLVPSPPPHTHMKGREGRIQHRGKMRYSAVGKWEEPRFCPEVNVHNFLAKPR